MEAYQKLAASRARQYFRTDARGFLSAQTGQLESFHISRFGFLRQQHSNENSNYVQQSVLSPANDHLCV